MIRRLRKFMALSFREKLLFVEAFLLHLWVGLLLKVVPFRWIPRLFASRQSAVGSGQSETPMEAGSRTRTCPDEVGSVGTAVGSQQSAVIENIRDAVQRAGQVSPWRNRCLVSSLAARCMLSRRDIPSQIWLGVIKSDKNRLQAHAWLKSGEIEVVDMKREFTSLYTF